MDRWIGLDVHAASCTAAVLDARSSRVREVPKIHGAWTAVPRLGADARCQHGDGARIRRRWQGALRPRRRRSHGATSGAL
jgi:hypothetical protein